MPYVFFSPKFMYLIYELQLALHNSSFAMHASKLHLCQVILNHGCSVLVNTNVQIKLLITRFSEHQYLGPWMNTEILPLYLTQYK